jgi:uncharacterized protein (PEP-CTERM system associated)
MNRVLAFTIVLLGALVQPSAVEAQASNFVPVASADPQAPPGWSFTPALVFGSSWDDNVLIRENGDQAPGDVLSVLNPRATLDFNGAHGQLAASYDGAFLLYRQLNQLNTFDQHSSLFGRRLVSRHVAIFVRNSAAAVPTTELQELVAVPFVRAGSRLEDLRTGIEAAFTSRTSVVVSYDFQWVDFDHSLPGLEGLVGGHSHGTTVTLRHVRNKRITLTVDYDLQHATLSEGGQIFDVQNAWAGGEYKLSEVTRFFAEGGVSRLGLTGLSETRTGPAWRLGLTRTVRRAGVDVLYSRSFVPSYGFGGTMQNEELTGRMQLPLGRRLYTTSSLSWRRDDPLIAGELPLRSYWIEGSIGYAATPRVRFEAFYAGTRQTTDRPGGALDDNRVGFQIITAKLMRLR